MMVSAAVRAAEAARRTTAVVPSCVEQHRRDRPGPRAGAVDELQPKRRSAACASATPADARAGTWRIRG